jgi:uncharacterized protein (DUF4415 family)
MGRSEQKRPWLRDVRGVGGGCCNSQGQAAQRAEISAQARAADARRTASERDEEARQLRQQLDDLTAEMALMRTQDYTAAAAASEARQVRVCVWVKVDVHVCMCGERASRACGRG